LQATIDERCLQLYGLAAEDLASSGAELSADGPAEADEEDEVDETVGTIDAQAQVAELLSWQLGVVFGRFDLRLATGARTAPPEPEPFDPLPAEAPGLLPGGVVPADYPLAGAGAAVLVEDQGHPADLLDPRPSTRYRPKRRRSSGSIPCAPGSPTRGRGSGPATCAATRGRAGPRRSTGC
ncbi:MAG TPA: hypothetical protein DCZ72_06465, partial [Armatimonadetes bacterium]|nr:hypothetical protein [Armatimonadota bacterium]